MPTKDQEELKRAKTSPMASKRIAARDAENLMAEPSADISATTSNRIKRSANEAQSKSQNDAAMAQTPIGQFQGRMAAQKTGGAYDPFANIPAAATADYKDPGDPNDLLGAYSAPQRPMAGSANVGSLDSMRDSNAHNTAETDGHREGAQYLDVGRADAYSRADRQRLEAMGPEYASAANSLERSSASTPKPMTATIGGKDFVGIPGQRVDRAALATLAQRVAMENLQKRGLEAESRKFGQDQTMARIPGQSAVDLARQQGGDKIGAIQAEGAIQAPTRDANIAKSNAETAALTGKEGRTKTEFDEANSPEGKKRSSADAMNAQLQESGADRTPEGQALMKVLMQRGSAGRVGNDVADPFAAAISKPNPAQQLETMQQFTADPEVARLIQSIQSNKQGLIGSADRTTRQAAERKALESYINRYAAANGVDPAELRTQIEGQLVGSGAGPTFDFRAGGKIWDTITSPFRG